MIKEYLATLNEFKSPGTNEMHPKILKDLAEEITELSIFLKSWKMGGVPDDWRRSKVVPIFQKKAKRRNS